MAENALKQPKTLGKFITQKFGKPTAEHLKLLPSGVRASRETSSSALTLEVLRANNLGFDTVRLSQEEFDSINQDDLETIQVVHPRGAMVLTPKEYSAGLPSGSYSEVLASLKTQKIEGDVNEIYNFRHAVVLTDGEGEEQVAKINLTPEGEKDFCYFNTKGGNKKMRTIVLAPSIQFLNGIVWCRFDVVTGKK